MASASIPIPRAPSWQDSGNKQADVPGQSGEDNLPQDPNPFRCNICSKSYSRIDHLARHFRAHTNEKPFVCHVCDKNFARADLLKRHVAAHEEEKTSRKKQKLDPPSKRARVAQACTACAEAKLKCETEKPCRRCQQKQIVCEYPPPRPRRSTLLLGEESQFSDQSDPNDPPPGEDIGAVHGMTPPQETFQRNSSSNVLSHQTGHQMLLDAFQMVTPATFGHDSLPSGSLDYDPMASFDDSSLANFLYDVMMPTSPNTDMRNFASVPNEQHPSPRDVLNFNVSAHLALPDFDASLPLPSEDAPLASSAFPQHPQVAQFRMENYVHGNLSGTRTPVAASGINLGAQAFRDSLWSWTPAQQDHGFSEQLNLSIPEKDMTFANDPEMSSDLPITEIRLGENPRDRILAMILSTYESNMFAKIVSSFPSTELLTNLIQNFAASHSAQAASWIHVTTLKEVNGLRPELCALMMATSAVMSEVAVIRKLGFAIQEAVRLALPKLFENDNSTTRELQLLQASALQLDIGLWSGDRRKMEIAESFTLPLITMMRRAGHYRRSHRVFIPPRTEDGDEGVEAKWRQWIEIESFKRLAFHLLIRDAQTSMSLLTPPLISYAELTLDLPLSRDLWMAATANRWREICLERFAGFDERLPSVPRCMHDVSPLTKLHDIVDMRMAVLIILYGIWALIWEYSQLNAVMKLHSAGTPGNSALITASLHGEVTQLLGHFHMVASDWNAAVQSDATLVYQRSLMSLHVSFEDLQLFAGKEGEEEARRVYPLLSQWADGRESRQAVWHAGQILRAAKQYRAKSLRDFAAVALYHASLALWAKSVVSIAPRKTDAVGNRATNPNNHQRALSVQAGAGPTLDKDSDFVWLDGEDGPAVQKYLVLGKGVPAIQRLESAGKVASRRFWAALSDPGAVMDVAIDILRTKSRGEAKVNVTANGGTSENFRSLNRTCPPLVENLSRLMGSLGKAADGMKIQTMA